MYHNMTFPPTKSPLDNSSVSYSLYLSSTTILALFSPVSVTGNALVCAAIWRSPSLRTASYILLAGLAFTDFCTGLIVLPITVAKGLIYLAHHPMNVANKTKRSNAFVTTMTIAGRVCGLYFFQVTILIMTLMSIERWLHMTRRSLVTARRALFTVAVLLLIPIPIVVTYLQGLQSIILFRVAVTLILLICLLLTSVAYFKVFKIIRRHQQQIHASELSQSFAQPSINFTKYKKSVFTILYILAVFYITYLPTVVALVLRLVLGMNEFTVLFRSVTTILIYLSSVLNPLLYLWRMNDIRNEVGHLVKKMFCRYN